MKHINIKPINKYLYFCLWLPAVLFGVYLLIQNPFKMDFNALVVQAFIPIIVSFLIVNDFFIPINQLEYNSKILRIKINTWTKKTIRLNELKQYDLTYNELIFSLNNGGTYSVNLGNIDEASKLKLKVVLEQWSQ